MVGIGVAWLGLIMLATIDNRATARLFAIFPSHLAVGHSHRSGN
jgi:hypothetical protein